MEIPRVYIVNLSTYNNGRTIGKWYDLPVNYPIVQRELQLDAEHGEEYAIHDYENFKGFKVGEYTPIQALNAYAEQLEEISDIPHVEELLEVYSIEDILAYGYDLDFVEADDEEDLALEIIEQMGGTETLDKSTLERYFNYEAYGRDLVLGSDYAKTSHGYVRMI